MIISSFLMKAGVVIAVPLPPSYHGFGWRTLANWSQVLIIYWFFPEWIWKTSGLPSKSSPSLDQPEYAEKGFLHQG